MSAPAPGPPLTAEYLAANKGPHVLAIISIFPALALIIVALRLYTRFRLVHSLSYDDFAIIGAIIFSIGTSICQGLQVYNGVGRHVQTVTLNQAIASWKALFASIITYNFALSMTKISILLQYLRIATERPTRMACWGCLWFTIIYCIETFFAGIFQCIPVSKFWNPTIPGKCVNTVALYYANAGINIAQDISLVVLPFFILRKLILPSREKITLMLILGLGGFATVASICRLHALYIVATTQDLTWDAPATATWSAIEVNIGIICSSLPTLRALFIKYWPKIFKTSFGGMKESGKSGQAGKGHYYNIEGSIMVKKTIAINASNGTTVEEGMSKPSFLSSHSREPQIRGATPESQHELSVFPKN